MAKEKDRNKEIFKMFKELKTTINISKTITMRGKKGEDSIELEFSQDTPFYKLYGELKNSKITDNTLIDVLKKGKTITLPLSLISDMAGATQKNILDVDISDDSAKFKFIIEKKKKDAPTVSTEINEDINLIDEEKKSILNDEDFSELDILDKYLESDVMKLYLNQNKEITEDRTEDKLIEIASSKIKSLVKEGSNKIKFKSLDEGRIVKIISENDFIRMVQEFRTI